jgi:hypothetical protein
MLSYDLMPQRRAHQQHVRASAENKNIGSADRLNRSGAQTPDQREKNLTPPSSSRRSARFSGFIAEEHGLVMRQTAAAAKWLSVRGGEKQAPVAPA